MKVAEDLSNHPEFPIHQASEDWHTAKAAWLCGHHFSGFIEIAFCGSAPVKLLALPGPRRPESRLNWSGMFESLRRELGHPDRIASLDYLRFAAILGVVVLHFDLARFHYGYLGVDLFFILSGFLVSAPLFNSLRRAEKISVPRFVGFRCLRILPSYFAFIFGGSFLAWLLYAKTHDTQYIKPHDLRPYVLFYYNYRGKTCSLFNHVWSVCVEEHFYIYLPALFAISVKRFGHNVRGAQKLLMATIAASIVLKIAGFLYNGYYAYAATHGRIDALAWGVLLRSVIDSPAAAKYRRNPWVFTGGVLLVGALIAVDYTYKAPWFQKIGFEGLVPLGFCAILIGSYGFKSRWLEGCRVISFYSYNWYLWHLLLSLWIKDHVANQALCFAVYLVAGFSLGVLANEFIEQPIIARRRRIIEKAEKFYGTIRAQLSRKASAPHGSEILSNAD